MVAVTWKCGKNFDLPRSQKQNVGATKVEAFLRKHLQLVSNALLLEIRAKEHLSIVGMVVNTMTRLPAANKAYRAYITEARPQVNDNNQSMEYLHQGLATNHSAQVTQDVWRHGTKSLLASHSIGVWRQVSEERC